MEMSLARVRVAHLLLVEALLLAVAAVAATYQFGDIIGWMFESSLTIEILAATLIWYLVAWTARRMLFGSLDGKKFKGRAIVLFGILRIGLGFAAMMLLVTWLVAAIAKAVVAVVIIRAAILLLMAVMFTGIAGGAVLNSVLAVQSLRGRVSD